MESVVIITESVSGVRDQADGMVHYDSEYFDRFSLTMI